LVALTSACSRPGSAPPSEPVRLQPATERLVALPDVSRMNHAVREQMQETYASLTKKIAEAGPAGELAAAYGAMGNLLLAAEYLDAAEPCYQNAQALAPLEPRWPYYLGHVYRTRGEPAKAADAFERALAIGPPDVATLVWLGIAYLDQGRPSTAAPLFARALALDPRSVAALFGQGRAALASRDYGRAVESFEQALSIDPRASMVHYPLALAYRGLGESQKAEAHVRQRGDVEVGPSDPRMQAIASLLHSATSYEKLGLRALDGRDWAAAASAFGKAVELAPENATLHHRLGTALSLSGDTPGAVQQFEEALKRSPNYAPAHFSLGMLLAASGRNAEAIERFSAAVRYEPENADARLQLAAALVRAERYQDARHQLLEGARLNPERPEFSRLLEQFRPAR
jgi:tetratricopeptide (TPR) repeat protein